MNWRANMSRPPKNIDRAAGLWFWVNVVGLILFAPVILLLVALIWLPVAAAVLAVLG